MTDDYKKSKRKSRICWAIAIILAVFWLFVALLPFAFMILNSFKGQFDMLQNGVFHMPEEWKFSNYVTVIDRGFFRYFFNSVFVVAVSLVLLLLITACASYPLARMTFRLRPVIRAGIIAMMAVPMHVTLIPIFKMMTNVGLYDTVWAMVGPYVAFGLPISIFILTSFMEQSIPKEIEEAAEIDGCGRYRMFTSMIFPLSSAGLSTLAIYNGVTMWNEFAFANTLTKSISAKTLPLALAQFKGENSSNIPVILAVLVLSALPMIILFLIFQDKLVKGMMAGAVKG